MKAIMATRFQVRPVEETEHTPRWWGTCPQWVIDFPFQVEVVAEPVRVVNPHREPCARCGGTHVILPNPYREDQ